MPITTLVLKDQPQRHIPSYFYRLLPDLSLSGIFVDIFLKLVNFKPMVFRLLENPFASQKLNLNMLTLVSRGKTFPQLIITPPSPPPSRHKEITDSPPGRETMYSNECDLQNIANIDDPENNVVKKFENHQLSELIRKQFIVWKCGAYVYV